jgi:predicted O-methyltransferase YrrM|tara:strand:+ start:5294 stop:5857 length:564 start_codon:yes stop_codon:yes gene_type:complete
MYKNINIESSYKKNNLGKTLYDLVIKHKPYNIVEFGCLYGYSTVAMAMALRDLGRGKIISCDIWDRYQYKNSTLDIPQSNIQNNNLSKYVEFKEMDFWDWLNNPNSIPFDFLHLDISNTGDIIHDAYSKLKPYIQDGALLAFEGGSYQRDQEEWMIKYNKIPINDVQELTNYQIVNPKWPSLSIIKK